MIATSTATFSFAGVSTLKGVVKCRFANDVLRTKVLKANGHTDIDIVQLKNEMTKEDAIAYLLSIDFDNGNMLVRAALEDAQGDRTPKAAKEVKVPKSPKTKVKAEVTMESIEARAAAKIASDAADAQKEEDFLRAVADSMNDNEHEDAPY